LSKFKKPKERKFNLGMVIGGGGGGVRLRGRKETRKLGGRNKTQEGIGVF